MSENTIDKEGSSEPDTGEHSQNPIISKIILEIIDTEKNYRNQLSILNRIYRLRFLAMLEMGIPLISKEEINILFLNIDEIEELHLDLYAELKSLKYYHQFDIISKVCSIFYKRMPSFEIYKAYCSYSSFLYDVIFIGHDYQRAERYEHRLSTSNIKFAEYCEIQERVEGISLDSLMITPIQRIPRYILLFNSLLKYESHPNTLTQLKNIITAIQIVATTINETFDKAETRLKVFKIQEDLFGNKINIMNSLRYFVRQGVLSKLYNKKGHFSPSNQYLFILFNDILLYASKDGDMYELKHVLSLKEIGMEVNDISNESNNSYQFYIKSTNKSFVVCSDTLEEKLQWLTDLNKQINQFKMELQQYEFNKLKVLSNVENKWMNTSNEDNISMFDIDPLHLEALIKKKPIPLKVPPSPRLKARKSDWTKINDNLFYNSTTGKTLVTDTHPDDGSNKLKENKEPSKPNIFTATYDEFSLDSPSTTTTLAHASTPVKTSPSLITSTRRLSSYYSSVPIGKK